MTVALEDGECSAARPGRTLPLGKTRYRFHSRLGEPLGTTRWASEPVWTGGKSRPRRDPIPDPPAHTSVAIPNELAARLYRL